MSIPADIQKIIVASGNSFHSKVTNFLVEKEWHTLVSPYYMDSATNKPREIDLIAERLWSRDASFGRSRVALSFKLFIECKYISQPTVFWFSDKDITAATEWVTSKTPLQSKDNIYTQKHHYLSSSSRVAKLFASQKMPQVENEPIYRAINQSLNAMVYLRGRGSIMPDVQSGRNPQPIVVEIPVILCNSFADFYRVEMEGQATPQPINENFQFEVNYAYQDSHGSHRSEYFLIDIVDFGRFNDYLEALESDKAAMFNFL